MYGSRSKVGKSKRESLAYRYSKAVTCHSPLRFTVRYHTITLRIGSLFVHTVSSTISDFTYSTIWDLRVSGLREDQ